MQISEASKRIGNVLGNPDGALINGNLRVLDDCGSYFFGARSWRFCERSSTSATLVSGSAFVGLPLGVSAVHAVESLTLGRGAITIVDAKRFAIEKTLAASSVGTYVACLVYTSSNVPQLEVFPLPTATLVNDLVVTYSIGWQKITNEVDSNSTLPIPPFAEAVFGELLAAFALGMERPEAATLSQRVGEVRMGALWASAAAADQRMAFDCGPSRNGLISSTMTLRRGGGPYWDPRSITSSRAAP